MPKSLYVLGLALGQTTDFSALAIVEVPPGDAWSGRPALSLPYLQRFSPGTHYLQMGDVLHDLFQSPKLAGSLVAVDQTGVGDAVLALVWSRLGNVDAVLTPITLSSGHAILHERGGYIVPKKELIGTLQVLLQTRRLHVARELPDAPMFLRELETFRVRVTTAGSEATEAWREGINDDLVFAVGLAAWVAEQYLFLVSRREEPMIVS
jgi:hypothetical protein